MDGNEHRSIGDEAFGGALVNVGGEFADERFWLSYGDVMALSGDYLRPEPSVALAGEDGPRSCSAGLKAKGCATRATPSIRSGLRPGRPQATVAGVSETIGGALIATGFLTPIGCALITGVMTQAIRSVHAGKGPWFSDDGWEYNVVLIAAVFTIAELGPGDWSLDHALDMEHSGPLWATAAVGAGVAGPVLTTRALFLIAAGAGLPV